MEGTSAVYQIFGFVMMHWALMTLVFVITAGRQVPDFVGDSVCRPKIGFNRLRRSCACCRGKA
jgi:hypothetical protein